MPQTTIQFIVGNPCQDAGQSLDLANAVSTTEPMEFVVWEITTSDRPTANGHSLDRKAKQRPLFGSHIKEAIAIVKDWMKDR